MANVKQVRRRTNKVGGADKAPLKPATTTTTKSRTSRSQTPQTASKQRDAVVATTANTSPTNSTTATTAPPPPTASPTSRNRSMSPPSGISEVPPGRVPIFSELGKVIAWTLPEWLESSEPEPLGEECKAEFVMWVNDDGTVERRPLSPEPGPAVLDPPRLEETSLGFSEYGVQAGRMGSGRDPLENE